MRTIVIPERWERIIDLVEEQGGASIEQIAQALGVSEATARRDLARIRERGLIERTRGGAAPAPRPRIGRTLAESRSINPSEKEAIGRVAAGMIEPGDTLMVDGGFTTYQVARHISAPDVTVVTNSFDVAQALAGRPDVTLIIIGGELNPVSGTTVGPLTERQITELAADKAVLGADAVSPEDGLTSPKSFTAQTKRAMIERSRRLIVVADYSKLGRSTLYRVAPAEAISTLITDDKADPAIVETFRAAGVEVIVAGPASESGA